MTKETFEKAIILVDHGSRLDEANQVLEEIAARVQSRLPEHHVQPAHMELAEPSVEQAFALCTDRGANEIIVIPYFLGPGKHSIEDIPRLCQAAADKYPHLNYRIAEPLGVHEGIIDVLCERAGL